MNLANKYRPADFESVVEQSVVVEVLRNMCNAPDLPNRNFLLIGSAGVGKTSLARICAKSLNNGDPNNIIEIDAASHNGVDSMREIVQQAQQYPVGAKYKVFIIDEVHTLSQQSWQVLLKVLEEGPARSVFYLCTTNPEKIPATILSRVQTFQLSKISLEGITNRLLHVLECEKSEGRELEYDPKAIGFIAKLANGGMRDALTLLDKALSYGNCITYESLLKSLNLPNYDDYFLLLQHYARKDNKSIVELVSRVYNSGVNFLKWFEGFHGFIMNVVKFIYMQDISETMIPDIYQDKISKYGTPHSIICLKLANELLVLNNDLKTTQYLQEVALTHLCFIPKKEQK